MGEEVRITDYDVTGGGCGEEDDDRVTEWEAGLPDADDLTPLSQLLISTELLSAFNITPEPYRSMIDVNHASQNTLANLRGDSEQPSLTGVNSSKESSTRGNKRDSVDVDGERTADLTPGGDCDCDGDGDGGGAVEETESDVQTEDPSSRVLKRPRLVWTPQLHKRFIEVVAHLGVKNAVPKTIMQLMNVEGLTRENVASHLQKYRLYLKRMEGPAQGPSSFSSHRSAAAGGRDGYHPYPAAVQMTYGQRLYPVPDSEFRSNSYQYGTGAQPGNDS